jgi:uncharacterized protein YndB with AHSA1/START domain
MSTTKNSMLIKATPEKIYKALTTPKALAVWLAPGDMKGKIHNFNLKIGGGYEMSLYYPESEKSNVGKTNSNEDRFTAKFKELSPNKIVETVNFNSNDKKFAGEMIMEITLTKKKKEQKSHLFLKIYLLE